MIIPKAIQHHPDVEKFVFFNDGGKFAGRFSINQDRIWDVIIFKRFRGNHLAEEMLNQFLTEFPGSYFLYVNKENLAARKTYEKVGFEYVQNLEIDFISMYEMKIN